MPVLQAKIDDVDTAWIKFDTHHSWLSSISGRGRLLGLQASHAALKHWFLAHIDNAEAALKEELDKKAALKKVVMFGQRILACERSILAKTEAKATEKVKQGNSRKNLLRAKSKPRRLSQGLL